MHAPGSEQKKVLRAAWQAALAAADPVAAMTPHLPDPPVGRLVVIAAGKAAAVMAARAAQHYQELGERLSGVVAAPVSAPPQASPFSWFEAGHPVPTPDSVQAGEAVLDALQGLTADDLVLVLLSGGASSLLTVPDGLNLGELRDLGSALLASGADITKVNTVRRKLCRLKGGGLAAAAYPARVLGLLVSDVVGDDPAAIGSGPTVLDPDTPLDALGVLDEFDIASAPARTRLEELAENWQSPAISSETRIIASGAASLEAAARVLEANGYETRVIDSAVTGDAALAAGRQAELVRQLLDGAQLQPARYALLSGGETTVRIPAGATGTGGRNSTFALALACKLWGQDGVHALAADTDGKDGSSDSAGAFVTPELYRAASLEEAGAALSASDSGGFFERHGHSLHTGLTGTNVNDLRIILLERM